MTDISVCGVGAVSPAGWGMEKFRQCLAAGVPLPTKALARTGWSKSLTIRAVPSPETRPAFLTHQRLRRTSPISHFIVAAGLEALGDDAREIAARPFRLGIVSCVMSGCVNYSRRFYDEVLREPATASPLVFPETVFNAPASHLAALLGTPELNYTLVGDSSVFVQGLAVAANWLQEDRLDGCLVVGAEECDWMTSDAFYLFSRNFILSEGAGAIYLKKQPLKTPLAQLHHVTASFAFLDRQERSTAAKKVRHQLMVETPDELLVDGLQDLPSMDQAELHAWKGCPAIRLSPKKVFGEGLIAATAWQCVAAVDAVAHQNIRSASAAVVGCNQQAIGVKFISTRV